MIFYEGTCCVSTLLFLLHDLPSCKSINPLIMVQTVSHESPGRGVTGFVVLFVYFFLYQTFARGIAESPYAYPPSPRRRRALSCGVCILSVTLQMNVLFSCSARSRLPCRLFFFVYYFSTTLAERSRSMHVLNTLHSAAIPFREDFKRFSN
jgi:hypothetical protein